MDGPKKNGLRSSEPLHPAFNNHQGLQGTYIWHCICSFLEEWVRTLTCVRAPKLSGLLEGRERELGVASPVASPVASAESERQMVAITRVLVVDSGGSVPCLNLPESNIGRVLSLPSLLPL